ncbi:MAG: MBL fold metallo-hydrolase [Pseudomonadota bacterium]
MRSQTLLTLCCLAMINTASAGNLTQKNNEKTTAVIAKVVEAYGGSEVLASLDSVIVEHQTINVAVDQSPATEPPWARNQAAGISAIDLGDSAFATINAGEGVGFEFHNATVINGDESFQLDYRAGLARPIESPNFDQSSGPFVRVTPALLVHQLQNHARTAHHLGVVKHDDRKHDVIAFSMSVGPAISLYIDRETHLITHSERVIPGFGLIGYEFRDYETVDGIPFNKNFVLYQNGELAMERKNLVTKVNASIAEHLAVSPRLERTAALQPDPMSRQRLGEGVHLIGGSGTYGLFIEMEDHVIAVGGTGGASERIAQLREVTDKPIRYGVLTHHHADHLFAVPDYADADIAIVTATAHKGVVTAAVGDRKAKIKTVEKRMSLSDEQRRVEVIDIGPTAHTEHLLVVWLPDERILFEADHFSMPLNGPAGPAVSGTRTFAEALIRHDLAPAIIVSAHSPRPGTMADLEAALNRPVADTPMIGAATSRAF